MNTIGIRSEQKHWDSRVSVSPEDAASLPADYKIYFQNDSERRLPFKPRVFSNAEYLSAGRPNGAKIVFSDTLADANVIIGTKELKEVTLNVTAAEQGFFSKHLASLPGNLRYLSVDFTLGTISLTDFLSPEEKRSLCGWAENTPVAGIIERLLHMQEGLVESNKTYLFFSHTHKGQAHNMRMLTEFIRKQATLLDYELLRETVNAVSRRSVYYSNWAGTIGALESLWSFGEHLLLHAGIDSPFRDIKNSDCFDPLNCEFTSITALKTRIKHIGRRLASEAMPFPVLVGISGYRGQVGRFAVEVLQDWGLPHADLSPDALSCPEDFNRLATDRIYVMKLDYDHLYRPKAGVHMQGRTAREMIKDGQGALLESNLPKYFPYLSLFLNCIVWNKDSPRLLPNSYLKSVYDTPALHFKPVLPVIGDITCDPNGSIECCRDTYPNNPTYMWEPKEGEEAILADTDLKTLDSSSEHFDLSRGGFAVMAVTNLPCEIPREASLLFSSNFCKKRPELGDKSYLECLAEADFSRDFETSDLPQALKDATILYRGKVNTGNPQVLSKNICLSMIEQDIIEAREVLQKLI